MFGTTIPPVKQEPILLGPVGKTLRGTAYLPDHAASGPGSATRVPTVLMLHGFTGNRIGNGFMFVNLGRALAERGIAAVAFDFLHSGESDGSFDQMLVSGEIEDALTMTRWLGGQGFVDRSRMAVLGHSLGALVACCLTARDSSYAARMLLAPTTVENLCRYAGEPGKADAITVGAHHLHRDFFEDLHQLKPLSDAAETLLPTLVVQAVNDELVSDAVSGAYAEAIQRAGGVAKVEQIAEADHAFSRPVPRRTLIETVVNWAGSTLK